MNQRKRFGAPRNRRLGARSLAAATALTVGLGVAALPAAATGGSTGSTGSTGESGSRWLPPHVLGLARETPELTTLVRAAQRAGLAETLAADGDLTVFAPTNEAFGALFTRLGVRGVDDIPVETLRAVLLDHVIVQGPQIWAGGLVQADWLDEPIVTAGGLALDADRVPLGVNDARVLAGDLWARNGVVHLVDKVLLDPDPRPTIAAAAAANPELSMLAAAVQRAGLATTLGGSDPLTVFAPTNAAFTALFGQLGVSGLEAVPVETLRAVLLDHVVAGELDAVDVAARIPNGQGANALGGLWLQFRAEPLTVNGASIVRTDVEAKNGTVHVIDRVLLDAVPAGSPKTGDHHDDREWDKTGDHHDDRGWDKTTGRRGAERR